MSLQLIDSVAAVGTFIVIGATAIAAVIQLRHLRVSNQLQGQLTVLARGVEDAKFNHWLDQARRILNDRLPDPAYRRRIADGTFDRSDNPWLYLANSYEWFGSVVKQGLIAEDPFMDVYCYRVIDTWHLVEDVVAIARREVPAAWENFEYLFVRAEQFVARHPHGLYPKTTPRAALVDKWLAADTA
jgi:hypothetical protein